MNRNFTKEEQIAQRCMRISAVSSRVKEMENKTTDK